MSVVVDVPVPPTGILVIPRSAGNTLYRVGDLGFVKYCFEPVLEAANGDRTFIVDPSIALHSLRPLAQLKGILAAQRKRTKSKERAANITYSTPAVRYVKPGELYRLCIPLAQQKTDKEATIDQFEVDAIAHIKSLFHEPYRADGVLYMLLAIRMALEDKDIEEEAGILGVLREEALAWLKHHEVDTVCYTEADVLSEGCYVLPMEACLIAFRTNTGRCTQPCLRDNLRSCPYYELKGHVCIKFVKGSAVVCAETLRVLTLTRYQNDCIAFLQLLDPAHTKDFDEEDVPPALYHIRRAGRWVFERYIEPEAVRLQLEADLKSAKSLADVLPPCIRNVVEHFPETQDSVKCAQRLHVGGVLRRLMHAKAPSQEYLRVYMKDSPSKQEIQEIVKRRPKNRRDEAFPCHAIRGNDNLAVHPLNRNPCPYSCNLHCFQAHAGKDAPTHKCWTTPEEFVVYFARKKVDATVE